MPVRVLFVCLGNICRSPTAEGVMRSLLREQGMEREVQLDSAGTGGWHVGSPPDSRAAEAAQARGIMLEGAARSVTEADFEEFDLLVAMDRENASVLRQLAPGEEARGKIHLLREFDPASNTADLDVPDPYYGAPDGFDQVLDLVHAACAGLLEDIRAGRVA
jgi:protein-tyrosine phosphatase